MHQTLNILTHTDSYKVQTYFATSPLYVVRLSLFSVNLFYVAVTVNSDVYIISNKLGRVRVSVMIF